MANQSLLCEASTTNMGRMELMQALSLPLGRSVGLNAEAAAQLLGPAGTLAQQARALHKVVLARACELLGEPLPLPRPATTTLMFTEHEHPAWALLAISTPPVASAAQTAHALQRQLGLQAAPEVGAGRWADWLASSLISAAQPLLMGRWGVLLPWACLERQRQGRQEAGWLSAELLAYPALTQDAEALALRVIWAALSLLHGGQPLPEPAQVAALALALNTLRERTQVGPLPSPTLLQGVLRGWLPSLPDAAAALLVRQLTAKLPTRDETYLTGIEIIRRPGEVALWRRARTAVQLVVLASPRSPLPVAWEWSIAAMQE